MATAKQKPQEGLKTGQTVNSFMSGKQIKVECVACYNEEGSWACVRPSHDAYKGRNPEEPLTESVLAVAIADVSGSLKRLEKSGLNRKAVIALIADDTKLAKGTIKSVLDSLGDLAKTYTK